MSFNQKTIESHLTQKQYNQIQPSPSHKIKKKNNKNKKILALRHFSVSQGFSFSDSKAKLFFSQTVFWETKHIFTTKKNRKKKIITDDVHRIETSHNHGFMENRLSYLNTGKIKTEIKVTRLKRNIFGKSNTFYGIILCRNKQILWRERTKNFHKNLSKF